MNRIKNLQRGYLLVQAIIFGTIGLVVLGGLINWGASNIKLSRYLNAREQSLALAEAGADYYRWHLAHSPTDFQDGTGEAGPYTHPFYDKNGEEIGEFVLEITPPVIGSTIVVIRSTGRTKGEFEIERTIETKLAIPSWAKYAVVANDDMRFGEGTEVFGPIHSNGGIRFDGLAHNLVTSARSTYNDPDHTGVNEYGVHTHRAPVDYLPPNNLSTRSDIFAAGREISVPAIDFVGLSSDLADIKTKAKTADGLYLPHSGSLGYYLVFKINDTVDVYKVTSLEAAPSGCSSSQSGWGTWSVKRKTFLANYTFPTNGLIFIEDNIWVAGQIEGARLTIASARFPESVTTNTNITIVEDLKYSYFDGRDTLALIAQNDINIGLKSEDNLDIHAALMAKNGRVGRHYYSSACGAEYKRSSLNLLGLIATNGRYGFAYVDGTGYNQRNLNYDGNLLYSPPPSFPLTSDQYQTISWREI